MRSITGEIRRLGTLDEAELFVAAKELQAPHDIVAASPQNGKLPVPLFSAGGIATPADASLMMQLGAESVFVGSGIFKSSNPEAMARAVVEATTHYADAERVAAASTGLGAAMASLEARKLDESQVLANRGWYLAPLVGVLALQGGVRRAPEDAARPRRRRARGPRRRPTSMALTGWSYPAASRRP